MSERKSEIGPVCEPVRRGFGPLRCLECGVAGTVSMDLDDMTADEAFQCRECEGVFGVADVVAMMEQWRRVLAFIDTAPALEE